MTQHPVSGVFGSPAGTERAATAAALPPPRRRRRLDPRVVVAVVLLLAGVGGTLGLLTLAQQRTPVLVAAAAITPGQRITDADVTTAELGLTPGVATLAPADRGLLLGQVAAVPIAQGQVLTAQMTAARLPLNPGEVAVSIAIPTAQAAGGMLQVGHHVQVLTITQNSTPVVIAGSVRVLAVRPAAQGTEAAITLAVPQPDAPAVAAAGADGSVALLLLGEPAGQEATG